MKLCLDFISLEETNWGNQKSQKLLFTLEISSLSKDHSLFSPSSSFSLILLKSKSDGHIRKLLL